MTAENQVTWWEKTVEYAFVKRMNFDFGSPFDGNHETVGDAAFANIEKFILVEFKKDLKSIDDERKKFINFDQIQNSDNLQNFPGHQLIFGLLHKGQFKLAHCRYFSREPDCIKSDDFIDTNGVSLEKFKKYCKWFIEQKKSGSGSGSASGYSLETHYENVIGISDGKAKVMTFGEFCKHLDLKPSVEPPPPIVEPPPPGSSYSPGM